MRKFIHSVQLPFSQRQLYALVADIPSYPKFVPHLESVSCEMRKEGIVTAKLNIKYKGFDFSFTSTNTNLPFYAIRMASTTSPFKYLAGSWYFKPLGRKTLVELVCEFEIKLFLLEHVASIAFEKFAQKMVASFVFRAHAIYQPQTTT